MHFKSLEMIGFKSFADKTRLEFEPGMTAIVGPNGCGKSNIADAIRWVMGEQSARLLRGIKMQDVIFNGTDKRKPLGFAEVSITLAGADKALGVDYNEVTVTRRAYRSGEGEYSINKNICRLKDINELFMGTGIGLSAYSIIEQGKIDMILSSKPEDRRFIFEEAAGITKYKERKREALRKLEATEENLLRLGDIIKEVKRQLTSVERQAARARRAKEVSDELKRLEIQYGAKCLSGLDERIRDVEDKHEAAKKQELEAQKLIEDLEAEQESLRLQLHTLDRELGSVQERRVGVIGNVENKRNRIEANERLIGELGKNEQLYGEEIERLNESLGKLLNERETLEKDAEEAKTGLERAEAEIQPKEQKFEQLRQRIRDMESGVSQRNGELVEAINAISRYKNELAGLKNTVRACALRATRLRVEERELEEKMELAKQTLQERRLQRERLEDRKRSEEEELGNLQSSLREAREARVGLMAEQIESEKNLVRCKSQLELISRYRDAYEGFVDGVKTIMAKVGSREGTGLDGILGVVAEKIRFSEKYELALQAALGYSLQSLLTRSVKDALAAIPVLDECGEASFLPLDNLSEPEHLEAPNGEGLLGRALDFVKFEPAFAPAAQNLFANTYLVEDLSSAVKLFEECKPGVRLATLSGELLVCRGAVRKIGQKQGPSPIVSRENEIASLREKIDELQKRREEAQQKFAGIEEQCHRLEKMFSEERDKVQLLEIEMAEASGEEARSQQSAERLETEMAAVKQEADELESQQRESGAKEAEVEKGISEGQKREEELRGILKNIQEELDGATGELGKWQESITDLKVKLATAQEKENSMRLSLERTSDEAKRTEDAIKVRKEQVLRAASRKRELAAEIEGLRKVVVTLLAEQDTTDIDAREREKGKASIYGALKEAESRLKKQISRIGELKDATSGYEVALAKLQAERDSIVGRIGEQYGEDLAQVKLDEQIDNFGEVEENIEKLKKRLKYIGPVNMVALEEHKELEDRLNFLTEQEQDLLSAKDLLVKAVDRINAETTKMFTETFEEVRANFKELFEELFNGGSANLLLEEGVDVLEAGVNIVAKPPGKKLQNISLFSGGERAMTAVALLFSILKVKPSPFCVLDEIDAPLDESNINLFVKLLQKFLEKSQFLIITHNKRTISMADIMYGITMEESGVSKVVSAKLIQSHEKKSVKDKRNKAGAGARR